MARAGSRSGPRRWCGRHRDRRGRWCTRGEPAHRPGWAARGCRPCIRRPRTSRPRSSSGGEAVGQRLLTLAEYVFTANRSAFRSALIALRVLRHANQDQLGVSDTDVKALAVSPAEATSESRVVTTVTPLAKWPSDAGNHRADRRCFLAGPGWIFQLLVGDLDGISGPRCLDAPGASLYSTPKR